MLRMRDKSFVILLLLDTFSLIKFTDGGKQNRNGTSTLNTDDKPTNQPSKSENKIGLLVVAIVASAVITIIILVGLFFIYSRGLKYIRSKKRRKTPKAVKEFFAEFIGTFILMVFGIGSVAQHVLGKGKFSSFLTINISWGLGVTFAVIWSGPISGGHINPAVTLAFAIIGRFPWKKVPLYWLAQCLGSFAASACVFGVYLNALNVYDNGVRQTVGPLATASIWSTYPQEFLPNYAGLIDQVVGTSLLLGCVLAISDRRNISAEANIAPFIIGLLVVAIGACFGLNCGYGINPARDLMPRLFTVAAGWRMEPLRYKNYWFYFPLLGQFAGGILGAFIYLFTIEIYHLDDNVKVDSDKLNGCLGWIRKKASRNTAQWLKEGLAEFMGTFVLVIFGNGSVAQYILGRGQYGNFLSVNVGYGLAVMLGVHWAGGVSGGHINPAVTLALAITRKFPWKKLPIYWFAQMAGAFAASASLFGVYKDALDQYDGGSRQVISENATAMIWSTYPQPYLSKWSAMGDQIFGTAVLVGSIFAITNKKVSPVSKGLIPLMVGLLVLTIGMTFGMNCGYGINPARDLGPRLFTFLAGWGEGTLKAHDNFSWVPIAGQLVGGVLGGLLYVVMIEAHQHRNSSQEDDSSA